MGIIKKLSIKTAKAKRKLNKNANRQLRLREWIAVEKMIKDKLQDGYHEIGQPMSYDYARKNRIRLNNEAFKTERLFLQSCVNLGITDFHPNRCLLNRFFGDVVFLKYNLVVEIDGSSHLDEEQKKRDIRKDKWLKEFGYEVLRVDATVLGGIDAGVLKLRKMLIDRGYFCFENSDKYRKKGPKKKSKTKEKRALKHLKLKEGRKKSKQRRLEFTKKKFYDLKICFGGDWRRKDTK